MNWFNHSARSLAAAIRLVLHDRDGLADFDNTARGFWQSFTAIIFVAPLYLFISSINWNFGTGDTPASPPATPSEAWHLFALALNWMLWPLVMALAARAFGLGQWYGRYVIVYNWSNVLIVTVLSVPALLFRIGLMPIEAAAMLTNIILLATIYIEWYLARLSLETKGINAAAVVLANYVLSIFLSRLIG